MRQRLNDWWRGASALTKVVTLGVLAALTWALVSMNQTDVDAFTDV